MSNSARNRILRIAIIFVAVLCAIAMALQGGMGRIELLLLWIACGGVVALVGGFRALIIVAAMIAGAYAAEKLAHWYYGARSGEAGISAAIDTTLLIMPGAAILSGLIAALLTRSLKKRPVA